MAVWVFYASLFHSFLEHGIFWNPDFHKVVWQHVQGVVGSVIITWLQISRNLLVKKFNKNG